MTENSGNMAPNKDAYACGCNASKALETVHYVLHEDLTCLQTCMLDFALIDGILSKKQLDRVELKRRLTRIYTEIQRLSKTNLALLQLCDKK